MTPDYSLLPATGLGLEQIATVINGARSEQEIEQWLDAVSEKAVARYQVWKKYKSLVAAGKLHEPVIPVIAGFPAVGKTTMARAVASALGIGPVLGGDAIRASFRELVSREQHPEFFTSVYGAWQFVGDRTEKQENVALGFSRQAEIMNRLMERIVVDRGIRDGESMVVEYLHFLPSQFDPAVLQHPSVVPVVLRLDSEQTHRQRIGERDRKTHLKGESARLLPILDKYRALQEVQCADARRTGVPVVATDDWAQAKDKVFDILFAKIRKLTELKGGRAPEMTLMEKIQQERGMNPDKK